MAVARFPRPRFPFTTDKWLNKALSGCVAFSFTVGAALTLTSCGGGGDSHNSGGVTTQRATVNIYHTLVTNGGETGAIDIVVNRKSQGAGILYLGGSTNRTLEWQPSSGDQYVQLTRSGDAGAILLRTALIFDPNETYSLFVLGETNSPDATRFPSIVVLPRDKQGLAGGRFRVRFVHALPDVGPVDIYIGETGTELKFVSSLPFRSGTSYGDIPVTALPFRITVTPAGIAPNPDPTANLISVSTDAATFQPGKIYTEALVHRRSDAVSAPTLLSVSE